MHASKHAHFGNLNVFIGHVGWACLSVLSCTAYEEEKAAVSYYLIELLQV